MFAKHRSNLWAWCASLALFCSVLTGPALADDDSDPPDRVARLSFLRGHASFQPSGDDQWAEASLNRPLGTGDKVYTDKDSRVELEIGAADIRLDESTTFSLLNLDDNAAQLELTDGTLNLHVRRILDGQTYEVDTPTLAFVVNQPGNYRIDIAPEGDSTMVTVFDGDGDVYGENNASYSVRAGNSYKFNDSALHDYEVLDVPRDDDFDAWCAERTQRYDRSVSSKYVSDDVIGYADLDDYGGWQQEPDYGQVWYPTTVEAGWAPYRSGSWSWVDPWGWTWVDSSPWGFAPFHYGRWAYIGNRWGWCPGAYGGRSIYAPALVGFVGGVGIAVGGGGPVGWFPLGPRDVYVPWYRASRGYFTNVNVRNSRFVNNTYITNVYNNYSQGRPITGVNYAYRTNVAAVTAVPRDVFVGSRSVAGARVHINEANLRNAPVVSRIGIAPTQASFAANIGRGRVAAPAAALDRRVIARTAPPPRSAPIASRIQAIERNGAQPLAANQLRQIAPRAGTNAAVASGARALPARVQVVGQNSTKPQPLPARGPATGAVMPRAGDRLTPVTPNAAARVQPNAVQNRQTLPSARFAPRQGPTGNNDNALRGDSSNGPTRTVPGRAAPNTPARTNSDMPNERNAPVRSSPQMQRQPAVQQRVNPSIDRGTNIAPQEQIRPAPQLREIPRNPAPVQQIQPRLPQQSVAPTPTPQPQQRALPTQPQYQQRSVPQQIQVPRNVPPPQERRAPPPAEREQRGGNDDKNGHEH